VYGHGYDISPWIKGNGGSGGGEEEAASFLSLYFRVLGPQHRLQISVQPVRVSLFKAHSTRSRMIEVNIVYDRKAAERKEKETSI
jgi:hypothetical protein